MEFSEYLQWDRVAPFLRHPVYMHLPEIEAQIPPGSLCIQ